MIAELTIFVTLAFHHLVIGGILIIGLFILNKVIKTTAEMRSWIWMTAFITATLVPFTLFSPVAPSQNLPDSVISTQQAHSDDQDMQIVSQSEAIFETTNWHFPSEIVFELSSLLNLFMLVWLCGSLWRSVNIVRSFLRTQQLLKTSQQLELSVNTFAELKQSCFVSNKISSPLVAGYFTPQIILPESIVRSLTSEQLTPIILHEQAHIQRKDIWLGLFQELIAIIFWWSPVIRILNHKIHIERELACDLRAARQLNNGKQYAQSLVDCAKLMITQHRSVLAMGLFSQKKELSHRVNQVLKNKSNHPPSLVTIVAICATLSISTIQAAQNLSPRISIDDSRADARHFSMLSSSVGEKLIAAVARNDIATIRAMQNDGVDINTPAIGDGTALIIAIKTNNQTMVQSLIDLGADVNQSSLGDGNPLITAAMTNNLALANLLISYGADVNSMVPRDETPLINATRRGYLEMTQLLVGQGADVNLEVQTGPSDGNRIRTPLNMAATQAVKDFLIQNGATK